MLAWNLLIIVLVFCVFPPEAYPLIMEWSLLILLALGGIVALGSKISNIRYEREAKKRGGSF